MDQLAQFVGELDGPGVAGVELGHAGLVAQHVGQAQLVLQLAQLCAVVGVVAVVDGDRAGFEVWRNVFMEPLRFGPYSTRPPPSPAGRAAVCTLPQEQATACWSYWVTVTVTSGISCCQ